MPISTSNYLGDQPDAQPGHARPSAEDLRDAFARNEFTLADQPIVPATTGAITGCEALLRWHHPTSGPVSPGGLVPLAEQAVLIDDARATLDGITAIRALGLSVALDDVGAGCSSPGYLQGFALDRLEVDRSFVRHPGEPAESQIPIRAMCAVARGLGMTVTAEGVGTASEAETLRRTACDEPRDLLFSRPNAPAPAGLLLAEASHAPDPASPPDARPRHFWHRAQATCPPGPLASGGRE